MLGLRNSRRDRGRRLFGIVAVALLLLLPKSASADPYLEWFTIETPRFRVHYHGGLEASAQRVATLAEAIHQRLVPQLGWRPTEVTQILLSDNTDFANGSATALPYNAVRMFVSAPDDMSALGEYDDWLNKLLTHEYVHILHLDNISGIPALVNSILGKTSAPNQAQPRWILEGLAVALESEHTGGGRLRSSQFDMFLRADVLENRVAGLDQISNAPRRWPSGNLWYLYGGKFIGWVGDVYGPDTFAAVATDYGANIIPWGINRSIRRATGKTYVELFEGWKVHLARKYAAQIAVVERRGLREGTRLTHGGRIAASPRFVPPCARASSAEEILYFRDDGHQPAGFYRITLAARNRARDERGELVARSTGSYASFDGDCNLVFDTLAPSKRRYFFSDLFRQQRGTTSTRRFGRNVDRLTTGRRAREPDVSPDGRLVSYVTNRAGTTTLRIAELTPEGTIENERALVPSARYEQAFGPRFSHDGQHLAYGSWTHGGFRDIRVVDVTSGTFRYLTRDSALDQQPTWSPDDRFVLFTSDRTGIANVYAYDLGSATLHQVTNVKTGAYMPELSDDGRTLFYIGYSADGFDLYSMPFDEGRFLPALPASKTRHAPHPEPAARRWAVKTYNPLPTLRPTAYELEYGPGTFGDALRITTRGSDIVGHHAFALSLLLEPEEGEVSGSASYVYRRLPFDFFSTLFRRVAPRVGYRYGDQTPLFQEQQVGLRSGVSYGLPGIFEGQNVSASYTALSFDAKLPVGTLADPFAQVTRDPHRGFLGLVSLGYSYFNADGTVYGISAERGFALGLGMDHASGYTGSDHTLTSFTGRATGYVPMPWADHHVFALGLSGGAAVGTYPRRGLFFTGGFVDLPVLDAYTDQLIQSAFVLRGYRPAQFIGTHFNLLNAEYRFPILYADRGVSTLPVFLRTLSGAVFADYGGAFTRIDLDDPFGQHHLGVGAELWIDLTLGYFVRANLRLGHARGLSDEAPSGGQTYFVAASVF